MYKEEDTLLAQAQEVFPQTVLSDEGRVYTVSNEWIAWIKHNL